MSTKISAGEAYVTVSVNDIELKKGLQDVSAKISEAATKVAAAEPSLSPKIELQGWEGIKNSLKDVRDELEKTAKSGKDLKDRIVITTGDIYNALTGITRKFTASLGGIGDQFDKMAQRTGLSTTALSEYGHAARLCGADVGTIEGAVRSMQARISDANAGMAKAQKTFERLGVDFTELSGLSPEEQFDALSKAVASVVDPTERAALAMKVFGSDGQRLLPMFNSGAKGLEDMREEARRLGVSIDEQSAKMGAEFVDATTRMKEALTGASLAIARQITPIVTSASNRFAEFVGWLVKVYQSAPRLTNAFIAAVGGIGSVTLALLSMRTALSGISSGLVVAKTALVSFQAVLSRVLPMLAASPVGGWAVLGGLIASAGVALWAFMKNQRQFEDEAKNALESGESERQDDKTAFSRLRELKEIEKTQGLTNEQIAEAARLAEQLRNKYGLVGISVDAVGRKIQIAADAQNELTKQMNAAHINELKAAIDEAEANAADNGIAKQMAREEVSGWELASGKKRGSWDNSVFHSWWGKTKDDERLWILENDENFQKRVKAAEVKNDAYIKTMKAELAALEGAKKSEQKNPLLNLDYDENALKQGENIVADFIAEASKKEQTELDARIDKLEQKRKELIDQLRSIVDPNGDVDWSNADEVAKFSENNATYRGVMQLEVQVNQSIDKQIEDEKAKAKAKAEEETDKKIKDAERSLADIEKRWANESRTELEKKLDTIDEETEKYREQLQVLYDLEAAKDNPDQDKLWNLWGADAVASDRADKQREKTIDDAMRKAADKFATPVERFQRAALELQEATFALQEAQQSGDRVQIVAALNKLGEASDKYDSLEQAIDRIGNSVGKSVGGSFSLWQAQSLSQSTNWNKQLYNENRTQTGYLREIARNVGRGVAAFG